MKPLHHPSVSEITVEDIIYVSDAVRVRLKAENRSFGLSENLFEFFGFVNAVIWESVFQRYSVLAKAVSFLGITGKLQVENNIVHLVAEKLWEPRAELKPSAASSRDFH